MQKEAAPSWVEAQPLDVPTSPVPPTIDSGEWRLLRDEQVDLQSETTYMHIASKLVNAAGVEAGSTIRLSFDPSYQRLSIHRLVVHRDGKEIDRLPGQEIKLLQRESGLDENLYDGRISAVLILTDIRAGDIVEYAYSIAGRNPIFQGRYSGTFLTELGIPVHQHRFRLICPADRTLTWKAIRNESVPAMETTPAGKVYKWARDDTPAVIPDDDVPGWFDVYPGFQASEYQSWAEVAKWAVDLFDVPASMPAALKEELSRIQSLPTQEAQILAALHYVQDSIRYLGIESGVNSHKPHPIDTVVDRRFGDCKDKSRLLAAMLRELGFDAAPALVHTEERQALANRLPAPDSFDHAVVHLRFREREYWLDATREHQGGTLETLYFPALGKALIVAPESRELADVKPSGAASGGVEVTETFSMTDYKGGAHLHVHNVRHGADADATRASFNDSSRAEIEKRYLNFYADDYPGISSAGPIHLADDIEKNEVVLDVDYEIAGLWKPSEEDNTEISASFFPRVLWVRLAHPETKVRTMPFALSYPSRLVHIIRIERPSSRRGSSEDWEVHDASFRIDCSEKIDGKVTTIRTSYEVLSDHVDAKRNSEYLAHLKKAKENLGYQITVPQSFAEEAFGGPSLIPDAPSGRSAKRFGWFVSAFPFVAIGIFWVFVRWGKRGPQLKPETRAALHRCAVCGRTDVTHPRLDFRVGLSGNDYCMDHLARNAPK